MEGFSLIELMAALVILSTGILMGVLPMQITALTLGNYSDQKYNATIIAQEYMSNIGYIYHPSRFAGDEDSWIADSSYWVTTCTGQADDTEVYYKRQKIFRKNVAYVVGWKTEAITGNDQMLKITVRVSWSPQGRGGSHNPNRQNSACHYIEVVGYKYLNLGDSPVY